MINPSKPLAEALGQALNYSTRCADAVALVVHLGSDDRCHTEDFALERQLSVSTSSLSSRVNSGRRPTTRSSRLGGLPYSSR